MKTKDELYLCLDECLMSNDEPSKYLNSVSKLEIFSEYPFNMLQELKNTKQSPKHHPEGSVWNHAMLVIDEAAKNKYKSEDPHVFMWAALLHDIGKPGSTKLRKGKITSYGHDELGSELSKKFLFEFTKDIDFITRVSRLVRWHMQILFVVNNMPFANVKDMKREVNIKEVALLGLCDRLGRLNVDIEEEQYNIKSFIEKCNKILD